MSPNHFSLAVVARGIRRWSAILALGLATGLCPAAEQPVPEPTPVDETNRLETMRGFLQLQEQLRATQLAIEGRLKETDSGASQANLALTARLQKIEEALAGQRARELEVLQSSNRVMLIVAGCFAGIGLVAMVFMMYFQWRAVSRLAEMTSGLPALRALGPGSALLGLGDRIQLPPGQAQESSGRLLGALDLLEKRIAQLEQGGRAAIHESGGSHNRVVDAKDEAGRSVGGLVAEGQLLLDADKPGEALDRFERALAIESLPEVLVKKGAALEKLNRLEAALECYDRAIAADRNLTVAYLHKGGVYNRLERFDEALECYEQALRSQERRVA